jgi:hypothetical protein
MQTVVDLREWSAKTVKHKERVVALKALPAPDQLVTTAVSTSLMRIPAVGEAGSL